MKSIYQSCLIVLVAIACVTVCSDIADAQRGRGGGGGRGGRAERLLGRVVGDPHGRRRHRRLRDGAAR